MKNTALLDNKAEADERHANGIKKGLDATAYVHESSSYTKEENLWDGLDLEMQRNQRENQAFQVLDEIVEVTVAFRVLAVLHIHQRANLGRLSNRTMSLFNNLYAILQ